MFIYQISLHLIRFYDNSNVASIKYQSVSYALDSKLIHDWKVDKFIEDMGCAVERWRGAGLSRWRDGKTKIYERIATCTSFRLIAYFLWIYTKKQTIIAFKTTLTEQR